MTRSAGKGRGLQLAFIAGLGIAGLAARPAVAQPICPETEPYVFILLPESGSMSWAPPCSPGEIAAGLCTWRCDTGDCWVPLQGDDPSSKLYQAKQALHASLSGTSGLQLGFASFNQDALAVRAKHWLYQAAGAGVYIPGWGAFPASGSQEVFGALWNCSSGSGEGCSYANPADLNDAWEIARMRQLPKLGKAFTETVNFYIRTGGTIYQVRYAPAAGATPGAATTVTETVWRCNTSLSCSSLIGQTSIPFDPAAELLTTNERVSRTNPGLGYFGYDVADTAALNTCSSWDSNTDTAADAYHGYDLRWPTDASDVRGAAYSLGDVIPQDWLADHRDAILKRLAPNLSLDPAAAPDFRTSPYFQDSRQGTDDFLRLKAEAARPLLATGQAPLGGALQAFRSWRTGTWDDTAMMEDFDWGCRRHYLVVITGSDGGDDCSGTNACASTSALYSMYGVKTYVVGFGVTNPSPTLLSCMASSGGTTAPYRPRTRQELTDTLTSIFNAIKAGS